MAKMLKQQGQPQPQPQQGQPQQRTYVPTAGSPQHRTVISVQSIAALRVSLRTSNSREGVPDGHVKSMITFPRLVFLMFTYTCTCSNSVIPPASVTSTVVVEMTLPPNVAEGGATSGDS